MDAPTCRAGPQSLLLVWICFPPAPEPVFPPCPGGQAELKVKAEVEEGLSLSLPKALPKQHYSSNI